MVEGPSILNDPPKVLEGPQLLHGLIDFGENSDACAVDFSSHGRRFRYTYREIQSCVLSLACRIQKALSACRDATNLTSPRQHLVPILLPQSPALYIAQLAILESGGAFCPVNLDAPKERIKFVVGDVAANLIITTPEFKHAVSWENGPKVLLINDFPPIPSEASTRGAKLREPKSLDLAYVMYTSGSSGTPKGVAVSHLAVSQSLLAHETHIPPFERFLQFAAPSFDVSVFEIFFPLKRGSTLVGCDRGQLLDNLPGMINQLEVDAAELTPTVVGSLLQKRANAPGLKLLLTIGEMLTRPIVEEFGGSETKEGILYGMYGPTEAAIHCTINPRMRASSSPGNIGVPFDTVSMFIAADSSSTDEGCLTVLTTGQLGELVLGGSQLAQGYLNREEQNKAAFIQTGGRSYYRTGDRARLLADGTVEILGRMSAGQVKLRGQRVELGEIEEAVYKHPGIKTASAAVISSVLVVFALVNDQTIGPDHVSKTCSEWLPKFMIPSEIILLQNFPYLPSGKVDKRKLESDYQKRRQGDESHSEFSATAAQSIVRETLEDLLGSFSNNIRLSAMGLDSLAAIQVASRLRLSGFDITTVAVLQAETPEELARFCENASSALPEPSKRMANAKNGKTIATQTGILEDIEYTMPCTPLQSAMLSETAINMRAYRNWVELELSGINDDHEVILALHALAQRNSVLRTGFAESQDAPGYVQIIWRTFEGSQIENVKDFDYNFNHSKDTTLHRPLRVQIRHLASSTRLLIHIHHALYDGWSLELLLDDLDTLLMRKEPAIRPSFARVVDGYLDSRINPDSWLSKDYWKDHLSHLDLRQLPNFHTRKLASRSLAVSKLQTSILTSEVETAARSLSSSPQSLFQAAYALLLSSYLGSSDICFGTVFSGRTLPIDGIEDIVGPCLSTLPIRVDISTSVTLKDLVQELNSTNRKHLDYSAVPLREIKSAGQVHPRQSLFDTLIIWQQTLHKYDQTRNHVSLVDSSDNLEFNLTLEIIPGLGNVVLKANYQESLLPRSQVDLLLRQVEQLSRLIVENCTTSLQDAFSHLSNDVLSLENENPQSALRGETLASPVERIAIEDPGRIAIAFASSISEEDVVLQRMSYLELNCRSNQIGQRLLLEGVLPDELVCIYMEKCVDLYASILSTAKVGVGYLPLTPDTPLERVIYVLREAKVTVVMAQSSSRSTFESCTDVKVIYVDEINFSLLSSENIPSRSSPENISYCVFTSGSTGTPKGVLITQGNLLTNLDTLEVLYPTTKNSRLLQSCSQAFDVSVFEIFFSWRIGACLCSATKDVLFRDIENAIRLLHVTHLSLTPTVAALVDPGNVPNVEFLVTAGEAVTQKVFSAWASKGLFQGYGPSETTNICTVNPRVSPDDFIYNIGTPLKNTSAFVVSPGPEFTLLPRGAEGEFCFGGSQVFRGYIDRSQETGKIIDHPKFGRVYRSGDFGRLMPDGSLTFIGRKDDQVKIRGQRVELGEINAIMLRSTEVQDCITIVVSGANDSSQQVVSFWTSWPKTLNSLKCLSADRSIISVLYDNLESALPRYMIPAALIPLSFLPSTSQGKIDKRALLRLYKALDVNYLDSVTRASRPSSDHKWTDLELAIAKDLSKLTGLPSDKINPDTSFFNLGIDSVSAISFSRILHQTTRFCVEISDILKYSSTRRLAERLSCRTKNEELLEGPSNNFDFSFEKGFVDSTISRFGKAGKGVQSILPCTPLQEAMLSAGESSSDKLYANKVIFNIRCDVERLQTCWQTVVQRHEILRTCFIHTDIPQYAYAQVVLKEFNITFGTVESIGNPGLATNQFEPPYSFILVQHSATMKLLFSIHHALYDGVALSILYEEIEGLYHGHSLPPAPSFVPFLQAMTLIKAEHSDKFWSKTLENVTPSKLPHINHQLPYPRSSTRIQRLHSNSSLRWVEESTRRHNTTLLAVCHAVWASLIAELLNVSDVCFGNVVSGRTVAVQGIERLVAPSFNTIPFRLQDVHKLSYLEAFRTLQSLNADALSFQLTPLRRIQSKFSPDGSRLFDTLFILQQPPRNLDPSIWSILEDNTAMDLPLVCEVIPQNSEDTLEIILHSHCSVIDADDALALLDSFSTKLQAALENPRRQLLSSNVKEQIYAKSLKEENTVMEVHTSDLVSPEMTSSELRLRDVFSSFANIHVSKIGRDVSIFKLGLDSISVVQIAASLRKQGHGVKSSDILEHPTIAKLSAYLSSRQNHSVKNEHEFDFPAFDALNRPAICLKNNIASDQVEAIRPCTAIQQGMIAQSIHSHGQEYVNSLWLDFPPNSSLSAFREAWRIVCNEHEMLRTGFSATDDPEHPFAMITYVKDSLELPWSESPDSFSNISIVSKLARPPWGLLSEKEDNRTLVKFIAHHALYDAQSIRMILSDVANAYYSRHVSNRQSITHLLGSILRDGEDNISAKRQFWEGKENNIIVNRFPDLTPLRVFDSAVVVREIFSQASIAELEEFCRNIGVTMQAAGQAAWARLLSAYIGESSTTFGMALSGRSVHTDADTISFPSLVTVPVRCDVAGTNEELLLRTMNSNILLHKHQFTPLTSIQKWSGHSGGKIFDTFFAFQKFPDQTEVEYPWKIVREESSADYVISLEVQPAPSGQVALILTFKDNILPVEHAKLLLRQYDALLLDTLRNPLSPCDVAPDTGTQLLSITPAKERELPGPVTLLHEFVERGAREWPGRKALEFASRFEQGVESRSWTYSELNKEGNKIAQLLRQLGVSQGQIIAICFDKCAEASFAIIGILKAGCSYVALDPHAPVDRLKFIVQDSGANIVLSAGESAKNIKEWMDNKVIPLDAHDIFQGCASEPKLYRCIQPTDTSYCLYTSGTTGTPKGCLISHENAVQAMLSFQRLFAGHWDTNSKWLQFASFHFDVSVLEQFWSWSVGICVASAPRDLIFEDIPTAIRQLRITHIDLTPSLAQLLQPDDAPSLCKGVFITGGEQLKQEILDTWGEHACIYNGYGPTEATIGVTMYPRVPKNGKPANIGPQFDNVGSFVLKPGTALPVLRGGVGELCVSGKLVGKGYLNRPDLTNERFPTLEMFDERVYRTGDLVRILHDGSFSFLGRADDQVKLRGQRLELSEINEVIKKSTRDLQEVVTLVLKHSAQQKEQLVTFFMSLLSDSSDFGKMISTIRNACKARLPGYMVPTHFVPIKALPLNANNKADARQLAALYNNLNIVDLQRLSNSNQQEKEWTKSENKVLGILAQALHVDVSALARDSTIFQLGLDSISIIGFSRTLKDAGLVNANLSVIKSNPAVEALVQALLSDENPEQKQENGHVAAVQNVSVYSQKHMIGILKDLEIDNTEVESIAPCTPVQEGMIYRFLESGHALYFNSFEFCLGQQVDAEKLLASWKSLISHLQILRTKFVETDDGYAQVVLRKVDISWGSSMVDYDTVEKGAALKAPFYLTLKPGSKKNIVLRIFHGLYDGNSLIMILQRLVDQYRERDVVDYGPPFLSSLAYGPLARVTGAQEFWTKHLQNWRNTEIPLKSVDAEMNVAATHTLRNLDGLEAFRKQFGTTQQAIIQAAWMAVLQTIASPDLTLGVVTSGRAIDFEGAEKVIGPLFNTVPFHSKIEPGMTAASLISLCHKFNMQMQDFQHTPLKDIQRWASAKPGQSLFDTLFVFQRPEADTEVFANEIWSQVDNEPIADVS
jgi:ferricrocin synthase